MAVGTRFALLLGQPGTKAGSLYEVMPIVMVISNVTLTIEPGVEARFAPNTRLTDFTSGYPRRLNISPAGADVVFEYQMM